MTSTTAFELNPVPERGSVVICVPVLAADEPTLATVRGVLEYSDPAVALLLAGPVAPIEEILAGLPIKLRGERSLNLVVQDGGEAAAVNQAMRVVQPADMAVVAPGCLVASEWLVRLRAAAISDSVVASATPLSIGAGGVELSVAEPNELAGLPEDSSPARAASVTEPRAGGEPAARAARQVRDSALKLRPRIATMGPGCVYIRRSAWELAGGLDRDLALGEALRGMARRASGLGLIHVAADDVLVFGPPGEHTRQGAVGGVPVSGPSGDRTEQGAVDDVLVSGPPCERTERGALDDVQVSDSLHEHTQQGAVDDTLVSDPPSAHAQQGDRASVERQVQETLGADESLPLRRSLDRARTALRGLSVTIDGRSLTASVGGTQTYVIELVLALAREPGLAVRVLIAPDISVRARDALATAAGIELLTYDEATRNPSLTDVVHRPQQVFTPDDLALLRLVGRRIVVGQQDLIAYHNDAYHQDAEAWRAYRRTTRLALAGADQVVFFSEHARRDALAEDLLSARRAHVVGIGADVLEPVAHVGNPPDGLSADEPYLLCLGADYAHKNRSFAIELLGALRELGWEGRLVLCGTHVGHGSSRESEAERLVRDPELARFVTDLGPVEEASKRWLYAHACALLYPTLYEGFGLIPLEAAQAGLPCLFAAQASLTEVAPEAATLVPWDAHASARAVLGLLSEGPARDEHMAKLRSHSVPSWDEVARALHAVYEQALTGPPSQAAPRVWQELDRESYIVRLDEDIAKLKLTAQEYQDAYHSLSERVSFGLPLIDSDGLLSVEQQRALMRIASRGALGALALAPLSLMGRGEGWRRRSPS
jgi:glycosyltransferase involved in cell wall biosynthesis